MQISFALYHRSPCGRCCPSTLLQKKSCRLSSPSIALTDAWMCFWVRCQGNAKKSLITCPGLVSVEKEEWGDVDVMWWEGGESQGVKGGKVSVGQLQWAAPGIQLIGRSERTLCPAVLSNSSTDNCSQDMCECVSVWGLLFVYLGEDRVQFWMVGVRTCLDGPHILQKFELVFWLKTYLLMSVFACCYLTWMSELRCAEWRVTESKFVCFHFLLLSFSVLTLKEQSTQK